MGKRKEPESESSGHEDEELAMGGMHQSPTVIRLKPSDRPKPSTICERCPGSLWFTTPESLKCYCRVMHLVTWSTEAPAVMTACDGVAIAEQMMAE